MRWHTRPLDDIYDELDTGETGLETDTVETRREEVGANEITGDSGRSPLRIFLAQFSSALIWVLLAAVILSVAIGHVIDAILIAIIR
jgi:Ca2+-transporting ATPase